MIGANCRGFPRRVRHTFAVDVVGKGLQAIVSRYDDKYVTELNGEMTSLFGRPYYQSCLWHDVSSVCDVLYCGKTVHPSQKVSEGVNRKPGSKSSFFGSLPYFYFWFRRYGH